MPNKDPYPATVVEVIDPRMKFSRAALAALRRFKASHPWRGSESERREKLRTLHQSLCEAYGVRPRPRLIFGNDRAQCSGTSCYVPARNTIILQGWSVTTYLHEFGHARGMNERRATAWSANLFMKVWPRLFARCRHDGHMLRAPLRNASRRG